MTIKVLLTIATVGLAIAVVSCSKSQTISQDDWGEGYPFTVSGSLECETPSAVLFKANGKLYAVNGAAKNKYKTVAAPISEVWKDSTKTPGAKMNLGGVIDEGLKLCN